MPNTRANPTNRCYYCKHELYTALTGIASDRGFAVVADGSNADDRGDYRPGRQAAREFGIRSPLDEAGLTKRRFASCHIVPVFARGTNPRRPACRRAFPITPRSRGKNCAIECRRRPSVLGFPGAGSVTTNSDRRMGRRRCWRDSKSGTRNSRARSILTSVHRPGNSRCRLPTRHDRSSGVSNGQPQ